MAHHSLVRALRTSSAALVLATALQAAPSLAQVAPAPAEQPADPDAALPQAEDATEKDIVVTGSRLGRGGYDAPTPVNVVGEQRVAKNVCTVHGLILAPG